MKFTDVTIRNFLAIGEAQLTLDGLGLVLVAGENKDQSSADSNGSGKSSIADAISWCLWGSTARGVAGDDVVNTEAGKDTCVSITIDDDGEIYRVDRYRKAAKYRNGLYLYRLDNGAWTDLTKGTNTQTQKLIERLLGCSEEVFKAAIYSGQEQMPDIPRMTDKELKLLVEQAAGVDVLANAYEIARDKLRERSETRATAQIAYDRAVERHHDSTLSIERLSDQSTRWATDQQVKIDNLKQRTTDAVAAFNVGKAELSPEDEQALRESIAECQGKIEAVEAERKREQVLLQDVATAEQTLSQLRSKVAQAETVVAVRSRAPDAAKEEIERVRNGVGKPCDGCGRPLEKMHLADAIARAEDKLRMCEEALQEAVEDLAKVSARVGAFEKAVTTAQQALADHRAGMTDVTGEAQRLRSLQRELQIIEATKVEVERLRTNAQQIGEQWKQEAAATNPFKAAIDRENDELLARAAEVDRTKALVVSAAQEEKYAQAVVDVFAPAGVRAHRLDEATPFLNERTAHYLGSLADGAIEAFWTTLTETKGKGELREKFSVTVESAEAPSFGNLSGGEKRKVRLACALALQDLVATRATKSIELWIGDEVDDALDPAGLERLMGVLEEKARDRGTVLIISHNDIAAFARKTILVEKSGGRATVSVQ